MANTYASAYGGSDDSAKRRKSFAQALLAQGADSSAVQHPLQAVARALQGAMGGYISHQADNDEKEQNAKLLATMLGGQAPSAAPGAAVPASGLGGAPTPMSPQAATTAPMGRAAATASALSGDKSIPRGIRNNNPLNIEAGGFTQGMPGYAGSDGRFARFEGPEQGVAAADRLLQTYSTKHGMNTIAGVVGRWAPSSDGNNVSAYAANVAKQLGVDPNAPLDMSNPEIRQKLIMAMGQHENGRPIQVAGLGGAPTGTPSGSPLQAQPQAAPVQMAQAGGLQQIPPEVRARAEALGKLGPRGMAAAMQILQPYLKPRETKYTPIGDHAILETNSGTIKPVDVKKDTNDIREYREAVAQGYKGTLVDYQKEMKAAGKPETNVNIDQKTETEFKKKAAGVQVERFGKIMDSATEAKGLIANVQSLREIGSRLEPGKATELKAALGPYAEFLGVKIENLDDMQAYKAIVARMAPQMRVPGTGASSDMDVKLFMEALPSLGKTPGGNEIISQTLDAMAEHKIAAGEIASRAIADEITPREAERLLRELPDPLTLWKKSRGTTAPLGSDKGALRKKYNLE